MDIFSESHQIPQSTNVKIRSRVEPGYHLVHDNIIIKACLQFRILPWTMYWQPVIENCMQSYSLSTMIPFSFSAGICLVSVRYVLGFVLSL
jgi:hypothetical protein